MSPFGPLIPSQPRVYFRNELLNDALPTAHYPLPTFLRPLFSYSYELFVAPKEVKSFAIRQIRTLAQNTGGARVLLRGPFTSHRSRAHKSRPFSCLQPLCRLFALFSTLVRFVFNSLQPLFQNTRGGGVPLRQLCALCASTLSFAVCFPPRCVAPFFSILAAQG